MIVWKDHLVMTHSSDAILQLRSLWKHLPPQYPGKGERTGEIDFEISHLEVIFSHFFSSSKVTGNGLERNGISTACMGDFISETEVWCSVLINMVSTGRRDTVMPGPNKCSLRVRGCLPPHTTKFASFLAPLVNTESLPWTLIDKQTKGHALG